ncbi:MAG: TetR/AcrR family transcriptional regulator [Traorella sp.]
MNRKELILQNALKEFNENGYNQTSILNIANKSGISKSTFFHYFKSKEELANELFLYCKKVFLNQPITTSLLSNLNDEQIVSSFKFNYEHLDELKFMFAMETSNYISEETKKQGESMYEACTKEIIQAQKEKRVIDLDQRFIYVFIMSSFINSIDKIFLDNNVIDFDYMKKIAAFIRNAIELK